MSYNAWVEGYVRAIQSPANRYNPHISIDVKDFYKRAFERNFEQVVNMAELWTNTNSGGNK